MPRTSKKHFFIFLVILGAVAGAAAVELWRDARAAPSPGLEPLARQESGVTP